MGRLCAWAGPRPSGALELWCLFPLTTEFYFPFSIYPFCGVKKKKDNRPTVELLVLNPHVSHQTGFTQLESHGPRNQPIRSLGWCLPEMDGRLNQPIRSLGRCLPEKPQPPLKDSDPVIMDTLFCLSDFLLCCLLLVSLSFLRRSPRLLLS